MITRRNFCAGMAGLIAAPYVIRNSDMLMPVRQRFIRLPVRTIIAVRNLPYAPAGAKFPFIGLGGIPDGYERLLGVPEFEYLGMPGGESWFDMYPKIRKASEPLFASCEAHNAHYHGMESHATILDKGIMRTQQSFPLLIWHSQTG